jgi:hypothetical protein
VDDRRSAVLDALLYAAGALFAGGVALFASIPLYAEIGRLTLGPYAAGALVAAAIATRSHRARLRARMWLALGVLVGTLAVPLALEVTWRAHTGPGLHAQSEAIVTEEAARALIRGDDPYDTSYAGGPLSARPLATSTHFPYPPGMLLFGLPRAAGGDLPLADARVVFAVGTIVAGGLAMLVLGRVEPDRRLRILQVLVVLPAGAFLLAAGGDDLPVIAMMLLATALAAQDRPGWSGVAAGVAAVLKQTAWLLLPCLAVAIFRRMGPRAAIRFIVPAVALSAAVMLPFVVWNAHAFVENVVRFPLGLGQGHSAAETTTLGTLLLDRLPEHRTAATIGLVALVGAAGAILLLVHPPASAAEAAWRAGLLFLVAVALAPAARFAYLVYPANLLVWGRLLEARSVEAEVRG